MTATVDDLFAIPEDERRHELIEGVIEPKGAASGRHGATQRKLSGHVNPFDRRPTGGAPGGWWFGTEVDIYFDPKNTFRPEPFDALPLRVGALFGDDDAESAEDG